MNDDGNIVKPDRGPVIGGVVFIVVGTVLLLEKLGYLPHGFAFHFWPMIFIVVGLVKIAYAGGRVMGGVFIVVGVLLQLQQTGILRVEFWQLWPVAIIIAGVAMLWQALVREAPSASTGGPQFDAFYIFGGGERRVSAKDFKGARLMSVFGGYKVDLRYADIDGTQAVIEANAIFGGGEIIVPEHWAVVMQGVGVFGAYEDKSRHFQPDTTKPTKTLVVKGVAVFGGIEIKN
jgi:predicted membrane protein